MTTTELQNLSDRVAAKIPSLTSSIEEHEGIEFLHLHYLGREIIVEKQAGGWGVSASLTSRAMVGNAPEETYKKISAITDRVVKLLGG